MKNKIQIKNYRVYVLVVVSVMWLVWINIQQILIIQKFLIFNLFYSNFLGPPDGDDKEYYRIIFDITFFFFVIVILLAILQGLIIDAFGELRDQLQSVSDELEAKCFICGIAKDYFDKIPRGFETHVKKEHDFANYLFFLMYLINKPETDYTGQETFVWEQYQKRYAI